MKIKNTSKFLGFLTAEKFSIFYEKYEDGSCLQPEGNGTLSDGECDQINNLWGNLLNSYDPEFDGDWEKL